MQDQNITRSASLKRRFVHEAKRYAIAAVLAVPVAFGVRAAVAEEFYATSNAVAPEVPQGGRVLVYKLASSYKPSDIVVFRNMTGVAVLGRVVMADSAGLTVARTGEANVWVATGRIVGRVVLGTR